MAYLEVGKFDFFIIFIIISRVDRDYRATLTPLSCSPNFLRASYLDIRTLTHELVVNFSSVRKDLFSTQCHACTMKDKRQSIYRASNN